MHILGVSSWWFFWYFDFRSGALGWQPDCQPSCGTLRGIAPMKKAEQA
jgi:hypothetical protein